VSPADVDGDTMTEPGSVHDTHPAPVAWIVTASFFPCSVRNKGPAYASCLPQNLRLAGRWEASARQCRRIVAPGITNAVTNET